MPDKLSEVFGDVLKLACGGGDGDGAGAGPGAANEKTNSTSMVSKIGVATGIAKFRARGAQRTGGRSPLCSVNTTDSADSTISTASSEVIIICTDKLSRILSSLNELLFYL